MRHYNRAHEARWREREHNFVEVPAPKDPYWVMGRALGKEFLRFAVELWGKVYPWTGSCNCYCETCACAGGVCAMTLSHEAREEIRDRLLKDLSARLLVALEERARKVPAARRWVSAAYAAARENPSGFIGDPRNSLEFWDAVITMQG